MSEPYITQAVAGWGRMTPRICAVYRPEKWRALNAILEAAEQPSYVARGLGRSYGDASVNEGGGLLDLQRLDRMLAFDPETATLHCESGVSLADIIDVFLPRGFFLPVTPGTKFVTVGGAIANDIHGKNHHCDGAFSEFVDDFDLLLASGETMACSREENSDVFWATIGGVGLTGVILTARIRLQPVQSAYIEVDYDRSGDLDDALATMAASDAQYQYSVAWVDCLAKGKSLGRSVLMRGNHAPAERLPAAQRGTPFAVKAKRAKSVPFDFPRFALNPMSIKAFNTVFYGMHPSRKGVFVDYDKYFYPLDGIHQWNRLYGKRGFAQYQATLPLESKSGLVALIERLSASRRASFLAVLKCFGDGGPGLLSHPMKGYTLTLDVPRRSGLVPFLHELDRVLLDYGGRLYLAKDAVATPETLQAMYPNLDAFREIKGRLDPDNKFSSTMSRRLGLAPA